MPHKIFSIARAYVVSFILLFGLAASAQTQGRHQCASATRTDSGVVTHLLLNDIALNGSATVRTFTVEDLEGYAELGLDVKFTHANNGTITFTCTGKSAHPLVADQLDTTLTTCTTASGTCTLNFGGVVVTPSLSASKTYTFPLKILNQKRVKCVVAHGGSPSASDKLTVVGRKCSR